MIFWVAQTLAADCAARLDGDAVRLDTAPLAFSARAATLEPSADAGLDALACALAADAALTLTIGVHTDSMGSDSYNLRLSQQRADAIVAALVSRGISESRLLPIGWGEQRPIAPNTTAEGRATNRRIELTRGLSSERPVQPAPIPVPTPKPAPAEDPCALFATERPPPGGRCETGVGRWSCVLPRAAGPLIASLRACWPDATLDGDTLYATRPGGTLAVGPDGEQTRVTFTSR